MATIKHLHIQSFRSIRDFSWWPNSGLNCLIGPGDSGKSTILDAVDLVLGARRSYAFNDADFYQMDTAVPITIKIVVRCGSFCGKLGTRGLDGNGSRTEWYK